MLVVGRIKEDTSLRMIAHDKSSLAPEGTSIAFHMESGGQKTLERHFGREQVQSIVERSKALEQTKRANKRPKRAFEMSR